MSHKITLLYDRIRVEEKELINAAEKRGVHLKAVDAKALHVVASDLQADKELFGDVILERCISFFRGLYLTAVLESKGITVINNFETANICGNKLLTTLALAKAGVPTPKTVIAFTPEEAEKALEELGYPAVIKPVFGSWGRLVAPLRDREMAQYILEHRAEMGSPLHQIYYIQEMVERPPRDIRTIVVGDELVAAIYRYAPPNEWRTNIARGGKAEPCPVTPELEELVLKAAKAVGGGVLGIDVLESPRGLLVNEVNSTVEFRGAMSATKIDIPGKIIDYALEKARR